MATNLVGATTINRVNLYRNQPATSDTTIYTVPAVTTVKAGPIIICNTTTSSATLTLAVVQSGGTSGVSNRILSAYPVPGNGTTTIDPGVYMSASDFISAFQGTSGALTVLINGETYA